MHQVQIFPPKLGLFIQFFIHVIHFIHPLIEIRRGVAGNIAICIIPIRYFNICILVSIPHLHLDIGKHSKPAHQFEFSIVKDLDTQVGHRLKQSNVVSKNLNISRVDGSSTFKFHQLLSRPAPHIFQPLISI